MTLQQLQAQEGSVVPLPERGVLPAQVHVFQQVAVDAVNAALAARRPLLVRGEPGVGKSQLARAAAQLLERPLVSEVIDSRTESRDLLYRFDAVARLGEAQLIGALRPSGEEQVKAARERLEETRFLTPGALWWGLDWQSARVQQQRRQGEKEDAVKPARGEPERPSKWQIGSGVVVLIDEIDKAEADVPNGLLEVLGEGSFRPPGTEQEVRFKGKEPPLIIITTNEERALPDAFVRRCLVLHLGLPELPKRRTAFVELLVQRGRHHFEQLGQQLLQDAANMLADDRVAAQEQGLPLPGQAEYLDLLRVFNGGFKTAKQAGALERIRGFTLRKHSPATAADEPHDD